MPSALVTGGAKRIGRAIVERLARDGFSVAIHCNRSIREAEELAGVVRAGGGQAVVVQVDFADAGLAGRVIEAAVESLGPLDLLVNSASEFLPDEALALELPTWERHFAVNLRAPVFLARDFAWQVPPDRAGAVVNILDQRVLKPTPQFFSYSLTKAALFTATRTLAQALAPRIRVNAVAPGPTVRSTRQDAADFARQSGAVLLGRGPSPEEIAEAVMYLARAESVTGEIIAVDGGQHLAWETPDTVGFNE